MIVKRMFDLPKFGTMGIYPLINVTEDAHSFRVKAELPGVSSDDMDIYATANSLAISGERKINPVNENVNYHRRERDGGKFNRIVNLPVEIDSNKVEASLADGILTVVLPKAESAKPRQITIKC
jgi:HSP20 family protein